MLVSISDIKDGDTEMAKRTPLLAKRFLNMVWVQLPMDWEMRYVYQKSDQSIAVSIFIDPEDETQKIRRSYDMPAIKVRNKQKDLWGMAEDCANEIKVAANENNKT